MYDCWTFLHTGHIGDIIAFLPSFRKVGGKRLVIRDESWLAPMSGFRYDSLVPFIESQGIKIEFNQNPGQSIWDMSGWRKCYSDDITLLDAQARYVGAVPHDKLFEVNEPWIFVAPDPNTKEKVLFFRTERTRDPEFPWARALETYKDRALFIGTKEEHASFESEVGVISWYKTDNLLKVAEAIKGSTYCIGNQSSWYWLAAGMFHPFMLNYVNFGTHYISTLKNASYVKGSDVKFDPVLEFPEEKKPEKTLLFCTGFAQTPDIWETKYKTWFDYYTSSKLQFDKVLIIDDCSGSQPKFLPPESFETFNTRLGRPSILDYPGWYRSFLRAIKHAKENGFTRIVHIEADAYILSDRMIDFVNSIDIGWNAFWCFRHNFPESSLQIICKDQFESYEALANKSYSEYVGKVIENLIPFTGVHKNFTGDRYGDYQESIPANADYSCQTTPAMLKQFLHDKTLLQKF